MKRWVPLLTIATMLLASCAPAQVSLWGQYATPTAFFPTEASTALPTASPAASAAASAENPGAPPQPTVTVTVSPTYIPPSPMAEATETPDPASQPILYYAQSGDTLRAVAARFGVDPNEVTSPKNIPAVGLVDPGTLLFIPNRIQGGTTPGSQIMPDAELIFSKAASDFNTAQFVASAGGHLSQFRQWVLSVGWMTGAQAIQRAAEENSVSPRILLALLEYKAHWVYGAPTDQNGEDYPMGFESVQYKGLFLQMVWTINQLYAGYYGWRDGSLTELTFPNGETLRLNPQLNAGTVALQYYFSRQYNRADWENILDPNSAAGFMALYDQMFGGPGPRAQAASPIFPPGVAQPTLVLPFEPNREWSFTGGPHGAWEHEGPLAAVDFAPSSDHGGCEPTKTWVLSASAGLVVRSGNGVVVVDLDGDGLEQTGWDILYLHIATADRVPKGTWLKVNDRIGHASCEGGEATGTHLHFARKYNGEWVLADGPLPMVLGGWVVHAGAQPYEGTLTRGGQTITADPVGQARSIIIRLPNE